MRILLVQESDWLKKGPHQQHHLIDRLSLKSHQIRVIDYEIRWQTSGKGELFSKRQIFTHVSRALEQANITVIRPRILKIPFLVYFSLILSHRREIKRQINEFMPDIIIGCGILNTYLAMRLARQKNIPFIYYWIDVLHTLIPLKPAQPLGRMIEAKTLKNADYVITINDKLKDYVIKLGANPERTSVLKAGVDLKHFQTNIAGSEIRKTYKIRDDELVLCFIGWVYRFSGLKEITLELAQKRNTELKLLVVGEGDGYEDLKQVRDNYNLQNQVTLIGKRAYQEIPAFIAASDICLLPSYDNEIMRDIVPIKMYEYMAMAKPVISTKLPGVMKEFGQDNGVIYIDKPQDAVGKSIELSQNGSLEEQGSKARGFAERHSWDSITDEFETILGRVMKEKSTRSKE